MAATTAAIAAAAIPIGPREVATAAPMGPAYLGLSQDLVETRTPTPVPPTSRYRVGGRTRPDPDQIERAARLLAGAARPLIVAGGEIVASDGVADLLALAERLGLETLAEGVETQAEHALLAQLGCGHVQGYVIARPMPVDVALPTDRRHRGEQLGHLIPQGLHRGQVRPVVVATGVQA